MARTLPHEGDAWVHRVEDTGLVVALHRRAAQPDELLGLDGSPLETNPTKSLTGVVKELLAPSDNAFALHAIEAHLRSHDERILIEELGDYDDPRVIRQAGLVRMGVRYMITIRQPTAVLNLFFDESTPEHLVQSLTRAVPDVFTRSLICSDELTTLHVTRAVGRKPYNYMKDLPIDRPL